MKKTLSIILASLLVASALASCNDSNSGNNNDATTTQSQVTESQHQAAKTESYKAAESFAGGTGTEADPFQISEAGHLVLLHEMLKKEEAENNFDYTYVKGHYVLTADIALNDVSAYDSWGTIAPTYGWEPIGSGVSLNSFAGVLDGDGHKITGMFIDASSETANIGFGLFESLNGTVKNLTIEKSFIRVSGTTANVGTIAGNTFKATIDSCSADAVIELYKVNNAGGITGNGGAIANSTFTGKITQLNDSVANIGGISGDGESFENCTFTGTLSGNGSTGGISGRDGSAVNCTNKGTVSGDTVGGIMGTFYEAGTDIEQEITAFSIENCANEGAITGTTVTGGIIGKLGNDEDSISVSVTGCTNKGTLTSDNCVSGIIGSLSVGRSGLIKVDNCTNSSDISGKGKTAGIIGEVLGAVLHQEGKVTISGCKNTGAVKSEDMYSAGIVTYLLIMGENTDFSLDLKDCTNEGAISSTKYSGGILGFSNVGFNAEANKGSQNISDTTKVSLNGCSNSGNITATSSNSMAGGIAGVLGLGYISTDVTNCTNSGDVAIDFTLTDEQIQESQGANWPEFYQIAGGIVGRIGDALKLTTGEGVEVNADNVNSANANIKFSGCSSTGKITAPDYSNILNAANKPLYVNYLGGIIGQCSATDGYAFNVDNCSYSGADRGLGDTAYADLGTKK